MGCDGIQKAMKSGIAGPPTLHIPLAHHNIQVGGFVDKMFNTCSLHHWLTLSVITITSRRMMDGKGVIHVACNLWFQTDGEKMCLQFAAESDDNDREGMSLEPVHQNSELCHSTAYHSPCQSPFICSDCLVGQMLLCGELGRQSHLTARKKLTVCQGVCELSTPRTNSISLSCEFFEDSKTTTASCSCSSFLLTHINFLGP